MLMSRLSPDISIYISITIFRQPNLIIARRVVFLKESFPSPFLLFIALYKPLTWSDLLQAV